MPPTTASRVDLPEPDGPTTLTELPAATSRSTPRRILTGPAALPRVTCTSASSIIADRADETGATGAVEDAGMAKQMVRLAAVLKLASAVALGTATPAAAAERCLPDRVLGDSLTSAYGLDVAQGFPAELQRQLDAAGYRCTVLDAGVAGDTSAGGRARLDWVLGDRPSHVIVELGGNDALRALPPEELERNLDAIITRLQDRGRRACCSPACWRRPTSVRTTAARSPRSTPGSPPRHDVPLYRFFLDGVAGHPELTQPDGIHPTAEGIALIVRRILPTVEAWLDRWPAGGARTVTGLNDCPLALARRRRCAGPRARPLEATAALTTGRGVPARHRSRAEPAGPEKWGSSCRKSRRSLVSAAGLGVD